MNKRSLLILFSIVLMDMVGFGFMIPILPDFVSKFGGSREVFGLLLSVYALGQFFAAPVVGRLSDRFGRKPLLMISIFGTFLALLLLGLAQSIFMLFVSRIIDGLTGGNITVAQSYITDITTDEERSKGLGMIGAAFGLGFIIGPVFGGILVVYGLSVPAYVAAAIALCNLILIRFVLPESLPPERRVGSAFSNAAGFLPSFSKQAFRTRRAGFFLVILFVYTLAFNMFETMFSPHAAASAGLSPRIRSFVLAYVGVIVAVTQGGLIGLLTKKFREKHLLTVSLSVMAVSLPLWGVSSSLPELILVLLPIGVVSGIISVVVRSLITKSVPTEQTGEVLGVSNSLQSLNRIIAPALGGLLLGKVALWSPGLLGGILSFVLLLVLVLNKNPDFYPVQSGGKS